jgi:hypothetical protein
MTNNKLKLLIFPIIIALVAALSGCISGPGASPETRQFNYINFKKVEISAAFEFDISRSDSYRVTITGASNFFEQLDISQSGDTIKIGIKSFSAAITQHKATITMPDLQGLTVSGACRGSVSGFKSSNPLDMLVSGASSVELAGMEAGDCQFNASGASRALGDLKADNCTFEISGASNIELTGSGKDVTAEVSGASGLDLTDFTVGNASCNVSGASNATVNASGRLDVDLSGASRLNYVGNPTLGNVSVTGSSTLSKK